MNTPVHARPELESSWLEAVGDCLNSARMAELKSFLRNSIANGKQIHPHPSQFFAALNKTRLGDVRVVVIGQDPYHGPGQAHGFSFSVPPGVAQPPSLQNILKEMSTDLGLTRPRTGCLEPWANQGVLLLNSVLSVEQGKPASHANHGWEEFTDRIVSAVNSRPNKVVFVLWGAYAQRKGALVDKTRHLVIESAHPSPFSAHRGFFGSKPFSRINRFLEQSGSQPIDWQLE